MKAYCLHHVLCPACDCELLSDQDEHTTKCINTECKLCNVEYYAPSIELEPVDKPNKMEYVIIHEET